LKYDSGDAFGSDFYCLFTLGDVFLDSFEFYFGRCLRPGLIGLALLGCLWRKNPAYPYRVFYKILRLEIGIDGFGVKKHVAS
jgi:hypothetical protein